MTHPMTLEQEIAHLKAENERLKAGIKTSMGRVSFKVSDKGAVSAYGLGRFPVTLYYSQWSALLNKQEELTKFLELNKPLLKEKPQ